MTIKIRNASSKANWCLSQIKFNGSETSYADEFSSCLFKTMFTILKFKNKTLSNEMDIGLKKNNQKWNE